MNKKIHNSYTAFIDQEYDGSYSPAKLVRTIPAKNKDQYFILTMEYTEDEVRSYRRNLSHKCIATFKKKRNAGPRIDNINTVLGSFLELDGTADSIKTTTDIFDKCKQMFIPTPSYVIETSTGHFHVLWLYENPLPWGPSNSRWWVAQQRRLIEAFADYGPDTKACLNPVQFLRNPTQLNPHNHKRKCEVRIHLTKYKTSLGTIQRRLTKAGIKNKWIKAETIIRQDLRNNEYIAETRKEWGTRLGLSESTMNRAIPKIIANGDLKVEAREGNNKGKIRATIYKSLIYLEPYTEAADSSEMYTVDGFSELSLVSSKTKLVLCERLLREFEEKGAVEGLRNKTIFLSGIYLKWRNGGDIGFDELYEQLYSGYLHSGLPEKEFIRTIRNVLKPVYAYPPTKTTLEAWGLI